jgi:hypothetical protein
VVVQALDVAFRTTSATVVNNFATITQQDQIIEKIENDLARLVE